MPSLIVMRVLGIETSCDDTGAAIFDGSKGLVDHVLASQVETHRPYGGVVPELAARDHLSKLLPLVNHLIQGEVNANQKVDAIAYTAGPGLICDSTFTRPGAVTIPRPGMILTLGL